jgi:hypothetical protein
MGHLIKQVCAYIYIYIKQEQARCTYNQLRTNLPILKSKQNKSKITTGISKFPSQTEPIYEGKKKKKKSTFQMLPNQISFQNHILKALKFLPICQIKQNNQLIVDKQTNPNPNQNKNQSKPI